MSTPRASIADAQTGLAVWAAAACGIVGALVLASRSSRRSDRALSVIRESEKLLLAHEPLRTRVGPMLAGGSFDIAATGLSASGSYAATAAGGGPRGTVHLAASRAAESNPWAFSHLRVEIDAAAIAKRAAERRAIVAAWSAPRGTEGDAAAATSVGDAAASVVGGDVGEAAATGVAVFTVVGSAPPPGLASAECRAHTETVKDFVHTHQ